MTAEEYNNKVWSSEEMFLALQCISKASLELASGKGWGQIPLVNASQLLKEALEKIGDMLRMHEEPKE